MNIQIETSLQAFSEEQWRPLQDVNFPFMNYRFLRALERHRCLGERTGWQPVYFSLRRGQDLMGVLPSFLKNNSYGEYIFDFSWAEAHHQRGLVYYPKLVSAVPFTPATGPKLLFHSDLSEAEKAEGSHLLISAFREFASAQGLSSAHGLFITPDEVESFHRENFMLRESFQYHWLNQDYVNFDDFLSALRSKRRREIRLEREQVRNSKLSIRRLTGEALTEDRALLMSRFYEDTVGKKGGFAYLTPGFFREVFTLMPECLLMILAEDESGAPVAGALNYMGQDRMFGRHWGCFQEHPALHFELCYYQGIEVCIERRMGLFEAGAQGEHKFQRGFMPRRTCSSHWIQDHNMAQAIDHFLSRERQEIEGAFAYFNAHTPYQRGL